MNINLYYNIILEFFISVIFNKRVFIKLFVLLFACFGFSVIVTSQQPAYFILGEKEFEGVQIYDVIQDDELNYWFATDQGFFKYDNYSFSKVDCPEMKGLAAFGFVKDQLGRIYCYNLNNQILKIEKGKCSLFYELHDGEASADVYLSVNSADELMIGTRKPIVLDRNGNRRPIRSPIPNYYGFPFLLEDGTIISHIGSKDSLLIYAKGEFRSVPMNVNSNVIKGILKFFRMDNSIYAISTEEKRIYIFKEQGFELIPVTQFDELNPNEFYRFYSESNHLWIAGTVSGVHKLSHGNNKFNLSAAYYPDYLISDVFTDTEGNLLLSTFNHGVLVVPRQQIPDVLEMKTGSSIVSIHLDDQLGMLFGTLKGELMAYDNDEFKVLSNDGNRPLQAVYSWNDFPFILFDDGMIKMYDKRNGRIRELTSASLKDVARRDERTLYLAMNRGVMKISIDEEDEFLLERIPDLNLRTYSIEKDNTNSDIYLATSDGLIVITAQNELRKLMYKDEPVFANDIYADDKYVYVAAKNQGILVYQDRKILKRIQPKLNGVSVELTKLVVSGDEYLSLSSNGFIIFNEKGHPVLQLNKVYGFSTNKIFDFEVSGEDIWLNHSRGIQKLKRSLLQVDKEVPLIFMREITVNDRQMDLKSQNMGYSYDERNFRFVFTSPTLRNKENIRYHFMLEGYNEEWQTSDYFKNEVSYNALAPGDYTFKVKAENQGVYSEVISYSFTISAPLYMRWWFITGLSLVILVIVSMIYRNKLQTQRKKAKQLNELNASKLTAIQSQMNPHFIFNSLNSIQDLVLKGDIDNSYSFITKFSDLVRRTLNYSEKEFIDFEQEIKLIELYLSLEKLRFKEDLEFTIDSDGVEDIMIPPMLIQPFIENALLHGLLHKEGSKRLTIRFRLEELLICEITDNGIGRKKSEEIKKRQRADHESFASNAIKRRFEILSEHYHSKLGFQYQDLEEKGVSTGTIVTLFIPVKHKF